MLLKVFGIFLNKTVLIVLALTATGILALSRYSAQQGHHLPRLVRKTEVKKTLNVKDFGARGDGIADDYDALQAAAWAVCQSEGATLLFPEGTYRVDRYRIVAGPKENNVQNIRYTGCRGTTITGVHAKIDIMGDFRRAVDKKEDGHSISYATSVIPFEMVNSSGFRIIGFEIEGNVDKMSRDPKVVEGSASGILTANCQDYFLEDITVHGFAADGLTLGTSNEQADQRAHILNLSSTHNARQGLAIIRLQGGEVINSVFNDNGRTTSYGGHALAAGVAVQPVQSSSQEDSSTGGITFDRCRFEENRGPQFFAGRPDLVDSITIKNSHIKCTLPDSDVTAFMSVPKAGLMQNNIFDIAAGHSVALAAYSPDLYGSITRLTYTKNTFNLGDNKGITAPLQAAPVELVGNKIMVESRVADRTLLRLDYIKTIEDNRIFEASTGYSGVHYTVLFERGNGTVRNNSYDTDRSGSGFFDVYYGPEIVTSGDTFLHPEYFQPHYSAAGK